MGNGSSSQSKVVKLNIPIIQLTGEKNNPTMQNFHYEGSQKLIVQEPFSQVESNYSALKNIYKDKKLDTSIQGIRVVHGLVGFQNLGNTCYFNTALHCLANTQPLMDYFLSKLHEQEINKKNPLGTKGEVSNVFGKFISEVWRGTRSVGIVDDGDNKERTADNKERTAKLSKSQSPKKHIIFEESISPKELISTVNKYKQEDCQELLAYLLDMIHEDLNRCTPMKAQNPPEKSYYGQEVKEEWAAESWSRHLQTSKSVIVDVFQGQLKSTLQCTECGMMSHKFEAFQFLSLPIPKQKQKSSVNVFDTIEDIKSDAQASKISSLRLTRIEPTKTNTILDKKKVKPRKANIQSPNDSFEYPQSKTFICSLQECLQLFSIKETLTGTSQWSCPSCLHLVNATKRIQLWKLPNVLIVHIKRFEYSQRGGKINAEVQFPIDNLDLSEFVCSPQKEAPLYTLYAVAQHQGSMTRGHYTAAARNRNDGQWYWYNDHQVMQVIDINTLIVNKYAYVLFYQKNTSENIFRQTLSQPDKWPHFTLPQQLSQTMPLKFTQQQIMTPRSTDILVLDDFNDDDNHKTPDHVEEFFRKGQLSQTIIAVSTRDIPLERSQFSLQTSDAPKFSIFDSNRLNDTGSGSRSGHTKNSASRTGLVPRKSMHSKQSQDSIFQIENFECADLRNIQQQKDKANVVE